MATSTKELREDVAAVLAAEDGVLTGEQLRELVRWEAAKMGMTYTELTRVAAKGQLPEDATELREHLRVLGVKVR